MKSKLLHYLFISFLNYTIVAGFIFFSNTLFSQNSLRQTDSIAKVIENTKVDSIKIKLLVDLAILHNEKDNVNNIIARRNSLNQARLLATETNKLKLLSKYCDYKGVNLRNTGKYNLSLMLHQFALEIAKQENLLALSSTIYNNIGVVYRRIDEYYKALEAHLNALKIAEKLEDNRSEAIAINSIGNIQMALGNYDEALENFRKSLTFEQERENKLGIAINLNNIGNVYFQNKDYSKAIEYYNLSLALNKEINSFRGQAICNSDLGKVYQKMGNINKAKEYYQKALSINLNHNDRIFLSDSYIKLGMVFIDQHNLEAALKNINQGLKIAKEIGSKEDIKDSHFGLYNIYKSLNQYKIALQHYDTFHIYRDSIMNISLQKEIVRLKLKFDSDSKENLISILEQQSKIDQLNIKRQKVYNLLILSAFIIALGAVSFLTFYLYTKNRSNKILTRKNEEIDRARHNLKKLADDLYIAIQQAEESNRIKTEFLANMSHEIRTPLNSVIGFSELMAKQKLTKSQKDYLSLIRSSANVLLILINDVLDLSKIEAGKIDITYRPLKIKSLIDELELIFKKRAEDKSVNLTFSLSDSFPEYIIFSELRLRQILLNLISNALKFTSNGNIKIDIGAKNANDNIIKEVIISVCDTGLGIDKKEQDKIFEAFYQADTDTKNQGTGLGLAITKRLVNAMNGNIILVSEKGKGSTFTMVFDNVEVYSNPDIDYESHREIAIDLGSEFSNFSNDKLVLKNYEIITSNNELAAKLLSTYDDEFKTARDSKLLENIKIFNSKLNKYSLEYENKTLLNYSLILNELIKNFDIDGIERLLDNFEKSIAKLNNT